MNCDYEIVIVGGGLAGLTAALHLSGSFTSMALIEKNTYPHHKVCGEYVSNEVLGYLRKLGVDPFELGAKKIDQLLLTTQSGRAINSKLPLGGFSISRYRFDGLLAKKVAENMPIICDTVSDIYFDGINFQISLNGNKTITSRYVIGAFGKRSGLDKTLNRKFIQKKTPWLAVKAHYSAAFPENLVALHHFKGGYCGISNVEDNHVNLCYLVNYKAFRQYKNVTAFEENVLYQNPFLKDFLTSAQPLFTNPLTIGQISFDKKSPVENHIFMVGDSAGLIHPLCGNGMAMAIHSAKLLSEIIIEGEQNNLSRPGMEQQYQKEWKKTFSKRLHIGRQIQNIFMGQNLLDAAMIAASIYKPIVPYLINKTHGKPIS